MSLPGLLRRLVRRPCLACAAPMWRWAAALCPQCEDRLPVESRWDYIGARTWRLIHPGVYRTALFGPHGDDGVLAWLATNPKRTADTTTTRTKEA